MYEITIKVETEAQYKQILSVLEKAEEEVLSFPFNAHVSFPFEPLVDLEPQGDTE